MKIYTGGVWPKGQTWWGTHLGKSTVKDAWNSSKASGSQKRDIIEQFAQISTEKRDPCPPQEGQSLGRDGKETN